MSPVLRDLFTLVIVPLLTLLLERLRGKLEGRRRLPAHPRPNGPIIEDDEIEEIEAEEEDSESERDTARLAAVLPVDAARLREALVSCERRAALAERREQENARRADVFEQQYRDLWRENQALMGKAPYKSALNKPSQMMRLRLALEEMARQRDAAEERARELDYRMRHRRALVGKRPLPEEST